MFDKSLEHSLDSCSNEHPHWDVQDLLEHFDFLNSCHWSEVELSVHDVDAVVVDDADYTYHICE